jgi:GH35 family endo-1,4-beta-xylanase
MHTRRLVYWSLPILLAFAFSPLARSAAPEARPLAGALERIDRYRKGDAVVIVVDGAGKPVADATVTVQQTRHAFLFGCNIFLWGRAGGPRLEAAYRSRFTEVFNFATLPFYWWAYEPRRGQTGHARIEEVARWCREQGVVTKGHPLAWNYADPAWLPDDPDAIRTLQMARIEDCVRRFQGLIDIWDVVNEATHFDRDECKQRAPKLTGMWQKTGQIEFVRECFRQGRKAGPGATLLINDYRTDDAYARVVTRLAEGEPKTPFDVIGIQSHMHGGAWSDAKVWEVCERFARFKVPLHFTETTILSGQRGWELAKDGKPWPATPEDEQRQADDVERFYTLLFSHPSVAAITWWDFSDRGAWQRAPAGFLRADMSPKPAYDRLRKLVKERWWTQATLKTDARGEARLRAFLGEHKVTVRARGKEVVKQLSLTKTTPGRLTVTLP